MTARRKYATAAAFAIVCTGLVLLLPLVIDTLPLSGEAKEQVNAAIRYPLVLVMRAVTWTVDVVGQRGQAEPASQYLEPWAVRSLVALSVALFGAVLFTGAMTFLSIRERRRRGASDIASV